VSIRLVIADTDFAWDGLGSTAHLARGTFLDVQPGSALEAAIGAGNLSAPADPAAAAVHGGASN
jgi:hypothetical protein